MDRLETLDSFVWGVYELLFISSMDRLETSEISLIASCH